MVDTQSVYDDLLASDTTTKPGYMLRTITWIEFIRRIIQDYIVKWNKYKQSKAKWRAYIADIPIIQLQNCGFY